MTLVLVASAIILAYGIFIEPRLLRVKRHVIRVKGLRHEVSLVFISDFHASTSTAKRVARRIGKILKTQQIDFIVLGGDYLHRGRGVEKLDDMFSGFTKLGLPILAVLGNHDYSNGRPSESRPHGTLLAFFRQVGIRVLENESHILWDEQGLLPIIELLGVGDLETDKIFADKSAHLTDQSYRERSKQLSWLIGKSANTDCPTITVCHNPDGIYLPGQSSILCLSGHTHGGQVFWVPLIPRWASRMINFFAMPTGSRHFWSGTTVVNKTVLVVSKGVGTAFLRIGRVPEMHVITLIPCDR